MLLKRSLFTLLCVLLTIVGGCDEQASDNASISEATPTPPPEFSFEEAATMLAERQIFIEPIAEEEQDGLLDGEAFDRALAERMARHPYWQILSVHLAEVDIPDGHFEIYDRPSYLVEITGPKTGNCFSLYYATDWTEFLGACFYPIRP